MSGLLGAQSPSGWTTAIIIWALVFASQDPALGQEPMAVPTAQVSGITNVCSGGSATIQAALTGTAPWSLVWSDSFVQSGITSSPALRLVSPAATVIYRAVSVSDAGNSSGLCSGEAIVRVFQPPVITSQPADITLCAGGTAIFSARASSASSASGELSVAANTPAQKTSCNCNDTPFLGIAANAFSPRISRAIAAGAPISNGIAASAYAIIAPPGKESNAILSWLSQSPTAIAHISGGTTSVTGSSVWRSDRILVKPKAQASRLALTTHHQKVGATVKRTFSRFGGLQVVQLPPGLAVRNAIQQYQDSGLVEYAEPDYQVHAVLSPNDPRYLDGTLWNLNNTGQNGGTPHADISAPSGWDIRTSASPIIVAVIDTGVWYSHPDLASNMWVNPCVGCPVNGVVYPNDVHGINAITGTGDPLDDFFHGTHCAGIIGGVGNNGTGVVGVAWNVQIMACKFLGADGSGSTSDAIECINYAISKGAKVLSNSWGGGPYDPALHDAIAAARDADVIFVAAAGNNAANNDAVPFYPASYASDLDNVIAVAATDRNDQLASFSNYGATSVALGAPGVSIFSTLPGIETAAMQNYGLSTNYGLASGTSMACPQVSGVMALIRAQYPADSCSQIIKRVLSGTDPVPGLSNRTFTGGRVNLLNALTQSAQPFWPVYQWRMNGTNIPSQTGSSYSFGPVTTNDNEDVFDVVVSNQCGITISTTAVLTVEVPCQITSQPTNVTQYAGNPATFSVSATGTHVNHRWRKVGGGWGHPWVLTQNGTGSGSLFIGSSTNNGDRSNDASYPMDIDINGQAFGINASGGHTMLVTRSLPEPLPPGGAFGISMDNGYVGPNGAAGITIYSASNKVWFDFFCTNNTYYYLVPGDVPKQATWMPFTSHGMRIFFDMFPNGTLLIVVNINAPSGSTIFEVDLPTMTNDPPDHFALHNNNAGNGPTNDIYFNDLAVVERYDLGSLLSYDDTTQAAYTNGWQNGDDGGTGPIPGATNDTYVIPSCTPANSGTYDLILDNACAFLASSNAILTVLTAPGALDHFVWSPISSPQFVNSPFPVVIRAQDSANGTVTNFTGLTTLSSLNGIAVTAGSGNFVQGVWTSSVMITQSVSTMVLQADDGAGHFGLANPINVLNLPNLQLLLAGNLGLFAWPAEYAGFRLETSSSLAPAAWSLVPYSPFQIGDQFLLPISFAGTNSFYRLRFPGP